MIYFVSSRISSNKQTGCTFLSEYWKMSGGEQLANIVYFVPGQFVTPRSPVFIQYIIMSKLSWNLPNCVQFHRGKYSDENTSRLQSHVLGKRWLFVESHGDMGRDFKWLVRTCKTSNRKIHECIHGKTETEWVHINRQNRILHRSGKQRAQKFV